MLNKIKLSTQIYTSYGVILILLLSISITSYSGFNEINNDFVKYRELARDTNLVGRVQANMLTMRLAVMKYINTQSDDALSVYSERHSKMTEFLKEAEREIQDPERARLISYVVSEIDDYASAFNKVTQLYSKRNDIVSNQLDPNGLLMREALSSIIVSAYQDDDPEASFWASQLQEHLMLARLYVTKFLVTNDHQDAKRAKDELVKEMPEILEKLDSNLQDPERKRLLSNIKNSYSLYLIAFNSVEETITERNEYINNTLNKVGPRVADAVEKVKLSVKEEQDLLGPKVQKETASDLNNIIIVSIIAVIAGLLIAFIMPVLIRKPIGGEPREIEKLVNIIASGDLSDVPKLDKNSVGIYRSIIQMAEVLKRIINDINTSSLQLIELAAALNGNANKVDSSSRSQMMQLELVATAMNEMTATVSEVAQNAVEASTSSNGASHVTEEGMKLVSQMNQYISQLATDIREVQVAISTVQSESQNVGGILDVIRGIADQTNLLALNAAIEAARAGTHGRGFAVVADEVRALATKTQQSTNEIQTMIESLQQQASRSVQLMSDNAKSAELTLDKSNEASGSLDKISQEISTIQDMNNQIATAAEEQSGVAIEINENVVSANDLAFATASDAKENVNTSSSLNDTAGKLKNAISMFKV